MGNETRINELLSLAEAARRRGDTIDLGGLCGDDSGLLSEVLQRLRALGLMEAELHTLGVAAGPQAPPPEPSGYEILGELGRGGMGIVYKARQRKLNRLVALKTVLGGALAAPQERARFLAEAEAAARLQHPAIVQIFEVGEHNGHPFFSLELCEGGSLAGRLAGTPLPPREAAGLSETLARAVHAAHEAGIVHRDLKPGNVLLTADGTPKVADFGLAKRTDAAGLTVTGSVLGTPSYMSPEQARGEKGIGPPADVYALGAILYEMLTGRPPFRAESHYETLQQVIGHEPVPPRRLVPNVPADLETICLKCLAKEPRGRFASAQELADDLRHFLDGKPIRARPVGAAERALKWVRRNPAVAALVAGVLLSSFTGFSLVTWKWREASASAAAEARARIQAEEAQGKAVAEGERANAKAREEAEARRDADAARVEADAARWRAETARYAMQLQQVQRDLREHDLYHAEAALDNCLPGLRGPEHCYLRNLVRRQLLPLSPAPRVGCLAFSPDGRLLACGNGGTDAKDVRGDLWLWDAVTGQRLALVQGFDFGVHGLAFSPDGQLLACATGPPAAGQPGEVRVFDAAARRELFRLAGHDGCAVAVAFSPDGKHLASAGVDRSVIVWDVATRKSARQLPGHPGPLRCLAYSPDGAFLAVAGSGGNDREGGQVWVWDLAAGKVVHRFPSAAVILSVAFSPDSRRLAFVGNTYMIEGFRLADGKRAFNILGRCLPMLWVAFTRDGRLVSCGADGTVRVWSAADGQPLFALSMQDGASAAAVSPDGQRFATASRDGQACVWDAGRAAEGRQVEKPRAAFALAFTPDGKELIGTTFGGELALWDRKGKPRGTVQVGHGGGVDGLAFSPDGRHLAVGCQDKCVCVLDAARGWKEAYALRGHAGPVDAVAFSSDGSRLASGGWDVDGNPWVLSPIRLWDTAARKQVLSFPGHGGGVDSLAFSPDGKRLASAGRDAAVKVWDTATGELVRSLAGGQGCVRFSADGRWLAAGGPNNSVLIRGAADGKLLFSLKGHRGPVRGLVFHRDGKRLISTGGDHNRGGEVRIWDTATGQELLALGEHEGPAAAALSPEGDLLATGDRKSVTLWDLAGREEVPPPAPEAAAPRAEKPPPANAGEGKPQLRRGREFAARSQWADALARYQQVFDLGPPDDGEVWFELACLRLLADDPDGYRRACAQMVERYGRAAGLRAYHVARACTLAPDAVKDLAVPMRLSADELANHGEEFWSLTERAALRYRAGKPAEASPLLKQSLEANPKEGAAVLNWLWLALAQQRAGDPEGARRRLDQAVKWLDRHKEGMPADADDIDLHLHNWLEAHVLRREAEAALKAAGKK